MKCQEERPRASSGRGADVTSAPFLPTPMRSLLAVLALLSLAACDSAGPEDALLGTWTLTAARTDVEATSRTAQTVPDRSAAPSGAISVTGATRATLSNVVDLFADGEGNINLIVESASPLSGAGYVQLAVLEGSTESQASLIDADAGLSYNAYFTPRRGLITRSGGRFSIAPITLSNGNVTATASGTIRYPEVALAPGTPTRVQSTDESLDGTLRFVFGDDGRFSATAFSPDDRQSVAGTWEIVEDGQVRVRVTDAGQTETVTFQYAIEAGILVLEARDFVEETCTGECLRSFEGQLFANPGSLSAVDFLITYRFGTRTAASARAAEAPPSRYPQRAPLPIVGRLLPETR